MQYWLLKSETDVYSWDMFVAEQRTFWYGVRNYQARNNLKAMKKGDLVLFYHSVTNPAIVGIAIVIQEFYQDPSTEDKNWVVVDIAPHKILSKPVSLKQIKLEAILQDMALIKQSRLSVMPVKAIEFDKIMELAGEDVAFLHS
jgi:predicted RNA-binding protein with PUA-like domain